MLTPLIQKLEHFLPLRLCRVLTDRGTEFCGRESHDCEFYLAVKDIDHSRTETKGPQTNGSCEHFHRTVLDEFYRIAFRKKIYRTIDQLPADLEAWLVEYNFRRPHRGRWCFGKTPMQTFLDAIPLAKEKIVAAALGTRQRGSVGEGGGYALDPDSLPSRGGLLGSGAVSIRRLGPILDQRRRPGRGCCRATGKCRSGGRRRAAAGG